MSFETTDAGPLRQKVPVYVFISAWAVPILMVLDLAGSDFGILAAVPLATLAIATLAVGSVKPVRWWIGATVALYATPVAYWFGRQDSSWDVLRASHPVLVGLLFLCCLVVLGKLHWRNRYRTALPSRHTQPEEAPK